MSNLITRARALYNLNNRAATDEEEDTLDALIASASRAIENYCWRTFAIALRDELYAGNNSRELILRNYPIVRIWRVAWDPQPALRVSNTSASNQRATVAVTPAGLELTRVASGVPTTDTILFANEATLADLAAAIDALGDGWSAQVVTSALELHPSADLRALQGAYNARNAAAELKLHARDFTNFDVEAELGILTRPDGGVWHGGANHWRILYETGFAAIPEDVQEACAEWVAQLFWQTKRDPGLASESVPGAVARAVLDDMPAGVKLLLRPYHNWRV